MHLSKVKHRPRYIGIKKINSLKVSLIIVNLWFHLINSFYIILFRVY